MEKVITNLRNEVEILRRAVAEEQAQKYEAYKKIVSLNEEINRLKEEKINEDSRIF